MKPHDFVGKYFVIGTEDKEGKKYAYSVRCLTGDLAHMIEYDVESGYKIIHILYYYKAKDSRIKAEELNQEYVIADEFNFFYERDRSVYRVMESKRKRREREKLEEELIADGFKKKPRRRKKSEDDN